MAGPLMAPQPGHVLLGYQVCEPAVQCHINNAALCMEWSVAYLKTAGQLFDLLDVMLDQISVA